MKKILFALILSVIVGSTSTNFTYAATTISSTVNIQDSQDEPMMESSDAPAGFTQELKKRFIEGGPGFMGIVLICLILGLAISIERIIYLSKPLLPLVWDAWRHWKLKNIWPRWKLKKTLPNRSARLLNTLLNTTPRHFARRFTPCLFFRSQ